MLTGDALFVEHPNLVSPAVRERDRAGMGAGIAAGREVLAWQSLTSRWATRCRVTRW